MAGKSLTINTDGIEKWLAGIQAWLNNFFATWDTYEKIAVGAIGLGVLLIVAGIIFI